MARSLDPTEERNSRFLALLKPIQGDCERWAYRLAGNGVEAQDLLSQSILNGLSHFHQLREQARFKGWMFKIIRYSWYQQRERKLSDPDLVAPEGFTGHADTRPAFAEQSDRARMVQDCLSQLSPEQREAIWLFEAEGLSSQEIAAILGKNDGAVRVLLKRARERLKELLQRSGIQA